MRATGLEPRLATVESRLESLTDDVENLASSIHEQSTQISQLTVAVTNAQAPRKTDFNALIAAAGLILAIGAAAFSPLLLRINDNAKTVEGLADKFYEHSGLTLHPVGQAEVKNLSDNLAKLDVKLQKEQQLVAEALKERALASDKAIAELDTRLQREFTLANQALQSTAAALKSTADEQYKSLESRVARVQQFQTEQVESELRELRQRRMTK